MKIKITQTAGSDINVSRAFYTYSDAHARRWTIEINGEALGVIYHVGGVSRRNGRLNRGEWVAYVCGARVAASPTRNTLNGMIRRALADADTLDRVVVSAGERADEALSADDIERFEKLSRAARTFAEAGRAAAENEALEV